MLNFETEVNGFTIEAKFTEAAVDEVFVPFLKKLNEVYGQVGG